MGLEIPREFGYVILTGVSSAFVIMYKVRDVNILTLIMHFKIEFLQGIQVGLARKKYGIKYPQMYATEDGKDGEGKMFNCIQVRILIRIPDRRPYPSHSKQQKESPK